MIRNLVFDLGGVLVDLDEQATLRKLADLGFKGDLSELYPVFLDYETGALSTVQFLKKLHPFFYGCREEELITAWNSIILQLPKHRIDFLEDLSSGGKYRTFLLSNTNELHIEAVREVTGESDFERFRNCFEGFVLSYEIGLRKPDAEIFYWILDRYNLKAGESLFIDDNENNIVAAENAGLQTWHLDPDRDDITELLNTGLI